MVSIHMSFFHTFVSTSLHLLNPFRMVLFRLRTEGFEPVCNIWIATRLGTFNSETHYRIYKNQTLTLTSTVGNIIKVEFTCTANDDAQYGPGCFTVADGNYSYSGAVGTWTGSANEVVFTASLNQVRASQIVVTLATETTGVENVTTVEIPVKVMQNGQLMIISGENVYNILGAQVK